MARVLFAVGPDGDPGFGHGVWRLVRCHGMVGGVYGTVLVGTRSSTPAVPRLQGAECSLRLGVSSGRAQLLACRGRPAIGEN